MCSVMIMFVYNYT